MVSPDFRAGYDAAAKAKQLIIDALEVENADLKADYLRRHNDAVNRLLRIKELEAPEPWWNANYTGAPI